MKLEIPEVKDAYETFSTMSIEEVVKIRNEAQRGLRAILIASEKALDNIVESECHICDKIGYGCWGFPPGWEMTADGYILCDIHISKFKEL